jgi:ribonuclease I
MIRSQECRLPALLLLLLAAGGCLGLLETDATSQVKSTVRAGDYDFYLWATEWAPAACLFSKCNYWPQDNIASIHGLWPSSDAGSPFECEPFRYDESNIDPTFKSELYRNWAGLWKPYWDFIKYECKKHGTCWKMNLHTKDKTDPEIIKIIEAFNPRDSFGKYNVYVKVAVYLNKKIDTFGILKQNGVVPSDSQAYPLDKILSIINTKFGLTSGLIPVCKKDKIRGQSVITEFRYCLDLSYNPIDCDPMVVRRNIQQCGKDPIGYPPKPNRSGFTTMEEATGY